MDSTFQLSLARTFARKKVIGLEWHNVIELNHIVSPQRRQRVRDLCQLHVVYILSFVGSYGRFFRTMHDMWATGIESIVGRSRCLLCWEKVGPGGKLEYAEWYQMTVFVEDNRDIVEEMQSAGIEVRAVNTHNTTHSHGYEDLLAATEDLLCS